MNKEKILLEIADLVYSELEIESETATLGYQDDLVGMGLDSLNVIKLVVALEDKYDMEFSDEYLSVYHMSSVTNIYNALIGAIRDGATTE